MPQERNVYLACSCNYPRKGIGRLSTLVSTFKLFQAVTVTIKQTNLFWIAHSMDPIRKNYEPLHLCEVISKLKYSLVCYALLTSFRIFNGGVVRRAIGMTESKLDETVLDGETRCPIGHLLDRAGPLRRHQVLQTK